MPEIIGTEFTVVGCGPGARDYVTPRAFACIARAELLAGTQAILKLYADYPVRTLPYNVITDSFLDRLEAMPARPCVVLVTGDAGFSSVSKQVYERFGRSRCRVEPGVGVIQVACAALGMTWQNAAVVDLNHQLPPKLGLPPIDLDPWIFLMGTPEGELAVVTLAEQSGRRVYVAEDLSLPSESVRSVTPSELKSLARHPRRVLILSAERKGLN